MRIEIISREARIRNAELSKDNVGEWYLSRAGILYYVEGFVDGAAKCIAFAPNAKTPKNIWPTKGYHLYDVVRVEVKKITIELEGEE
jgi:hypothetical protein